MHQHLEKQFKKSFMTTAFISDLHLSAQRPDITLRFQHFIENDLNDIETLYILGDLFEYWIGDDATDVLGLREIINALKQLSDSGIKGFFISGNRDFLIGEQFSHETGFSILPDETVIELGGRQVVILHGDSLCTDDVIHQQFRKEMMCNPEFHQYALSMPIPERIETAKKLRGMSAEHKSEISEEIMDVNENAVVQLFEQKGVTQMIHGHTHRPNIHLHTTSQGEAERIVLGDWYSQSSFLTHDGAGFRLSNLA